MAFQKHLSIRIMKHLIGQICSRSGIANAHRFISRWAVQSKEHSRQFQKRHAKEMKKVAKAKDAQIEEQQNALVKFDEDLSILEEERHI